jgi:hypothetical protein
MVGAGKKKKKGRFCREIKQIRIGPKTILTLTPENVISSTCLLPPWPIFFKSDENDHPEKIGGKIGKVALF